MEHEGHRHASTTLLELVSEGRRTAIGEFITFYEPLLEFWVRRHLGPRRFRAEGEDLLQTIRVALVKGLPSVEGKDRRALVAWIRKVQIEARRRDSSVHSRCGVRFYVA